MLMMISRMIAIKEQLSDIWKKLEMEKIRWLKKTSPMKWGKCEQAGKIQRKDEIY